MADLTLQQEQYEALIALARKGTTNEGEARALDAFLRSLEVANGITRHFVLVQWQEAAQPLPPSTNFPGKWPPELRASIELITRPIARADVDALVAARAKSPINVLVTSDPGGIVGWTQLDKFFL